MNVLKELTIIVGKNKLKGLKMKDITLDQGSKMSLLYQGLIDGTFHSEEAAQAHLFPEDDNLNNLRYVKKELRNRLLNYLFFINLDVASFTDRQKAFLECHKQWAMVNILLGRGARYSAISIAEKLIKKAIRFEFIEIVLDISKNLRLHYGGILFNKKKYYQYRDIYEQYEQYLINENRLEGEYSGIIFESFVQKSSKFDLKTFASEKFQKIKSLLEKTPTYKAQLYGLLIETMTYSNTNESQQLVEVCDKAIQFFEQKKYQANTPLQIFYYQKVIAFTQLRKFPEGKIAAEKCLSFLEEGTFNWFRYYESYFMLAMHTKAYENAHEIFVKITNHNRIDTMPGAIIEIWKIYEAYLFFLQGINKLGKEQLLTKFRLGRFLNDIPNYSKEKQGMNIAILIIQVLLYIQKKSFSKAIDRIEALEKYITRYLKSEKTMRSYIFIKMLVAIPKHSFHKAAVLRHTQQLTKKLETQPLEVADQDHKIEIIPYETLWEMSINMLDNKFQS